MHLYWNTICFNFVIYFKFKESIILINNINPPSLWNLRAACWLSVMRPCDFYRIHTMYSWLKRVKREQHQVLWWQKMFCLLSLGLSCCLTWQGDLVPNTKTSLITWLTGHLVTAQTANQQSHILLILMSKLHFCHLQLCPNCLHACVICWTQNKKYDWTKVSWLSAGEWFTIFHHLPVALSVIPLAHPSIIRYL